MSITDNAELTGLLAARAKARNTLTRQQETVRASIALVKMLDEAIAKLEKGK